MSELHDGLYHNASSRDFDRETKEKRRCWGKRLVSIVAMVALIGITVAVAMMIRKSNSSKSSTDDTANSNSSSSIAAATQATSLNVSKNCASVPAQKRTVVFWQSEVAGCEKVPDGVTHVVFGFALAESSGQIIPTFQTTDSAMKTCVAALQKRCITVMGSVGGSTNTANMSAVVDNDKFAKSAVALLEQFGFDGLDIDDESVGGAFKAEAVVARVKATREAMQAKYPKSLLTYDTYFREGEPAFCSNASIAEYTRCFPKQVLAYVDWINIMAYNVDTDEGRAAAVYEAALTGTFADWATQMDGDFTRATIGICVGASCAYGPGPSSAVIQQWNTFARQANHGGMMLYAASTDVLDDFAVTKTILAK